MGLGDFFKSSSEKEVLQTPEEAAARKSLAATLARGTPNLPTQEIAGLSQDQKTAQAMTRKFAKSEPEGMQHFRDVAGGSGNILDNPAYKALFDKVREAGELETNRVGRTLQQRGGTSSSTGANVLGRTVEQGESNLLATLAPYQDAMENRRMTAAQSLAQLGDSSILNRLNALSRTGDLTRRLEQMRKDADFTRKTAMTLFPWQQGQSVANTILSNKADWTVTQSPSLFSQIAAPVARVGAALANNFSKENVPEDDEDNKYGWLSGAAQGASMGSAAGPWGALAGGVAGAFMKK